MLCRIVDFFKEMPQFCIKVGFILTGLYGSDWEKRLELQELQANLVHLCSLGRHYRRAYQELFLLNDGKPANNSSELNVQQASEYYDFGWLLFLVLRNQASSAVKNLLTSTTELVSVLVRTPYYYLSQMCCLIFSSYATRQNVRV